MHIQTLKTHQDNRIHFGMTVKRARLLLDLLEKNQVTVEQFNNKLYVPALYEFWKDANRFTVARNLKLALKIHDHPQLMKLREEQINITRKLLLKQARYTQQGVVVVDLDGVIFNEQKLYQEWGRFKKNPIAYTLIKLGLVDKRAPKPFVRYFLKSIYDPWIHNNQHAIFNDMTNLIKDLQAKKVKVVGLTSRSERLADKTRNDLAQQAGIILDSIVFKPIHAADGGLNIEHKTRALMKLSHTNKILGVIGDNVTDLLPNNLSGFHLPNIKNTLNVHLPNVLNTTGFAQ